MIVLSDIDMQFNELKHFRVENVAALPVPAGGAEGQMVYMGGDLYYYNGADWVRIGTGEEIEDPVQGFDFDVYSIGSITVVNKVIEYSRLVKTAYMVRYELMFRADVQDQGGGSEITEIELLGIKPPRRTLDWKYPVGQAHISGYPVSARVFVVFDVVPQFWFYVQSAQGGSLGIKLSPGQQITLGVAATFSYVV